MNNVMEILIKNKKETFLFGLLVFENLLGNTFGSLLQQVDLS